MKAAKDMRFGRTPCFFAISLLRSFMAAICGAASARARGYVIAPVVSHIFISSSAFLCSINHIICYDNADGKRYIREG